MPVPVLCVLGDLCGVISNRGSLRGPGRGVRGLGEIPEFPEMPAVGSSARMVAGGLETEFVVPAELPKAVQKYVQGLRR